mgnify:FL=1|tara:strand:- start:239 stop:493 length:255 start_codon:yes stop_codon:yes gene_type:complete
MNKERLDKYIESLNEEQKVEYVKKTAQNLHKLIKQKEKASTREFNTPTHSSRALRNTVYAKTYKISKVYNDEVEVLKYIVNKLY